MANEFMDAVFAETTPEKLIIVQFRNGRSDVYTMAIFDLLCESPEVEYILDGETGEVLYNTNE